MLSARPISSNGDVDAQQPILNAKTPGRRTLKGRSVLQENALHNGAKTVLSKKNILQTPFRPGTAHAGKKPLVSISVTRPLMDKTPFPNRIAAASFGGAGPAGKTPGGTKLSKLALLISEPQPQQQSLSPDVAPLLRPSSARKSLRGRLSGSNFKTPLTKGNYWDVSPGDLDGIGGVAENSKQETDMAVAADEEDDEIEYMPPTAVELPYEPPFEMPDYKAMGRALFALGHGGLADDTADVYYAMDIEQQVDIKQLCADAGFTSARSEDSGLWLPELEDDSPFARKPKPKSTSGPAPVPPSQADSEGRGRGPTTSKSASSIPLVRTASTRASSSRTQPTSTVPARPATTTPPNQSRPTSASSSSRLPQPTIVVAPGQTRTSALRAAKAAAAAAAASASAGLSAPKANPNAATRRAVASAPSSSSTPANIAAGGGQTQTQSKTKTRMQAQAPPTRSGGQAKVQAQTRAQARAPGEPRPITIARSVTSGATSANANAYAYAKTIMSTGTGVGASAGTGTSVAGASTRARSATVMAANANANARVLGGPSGVKGTGARGAAGGKAMADRAGGGEGDELAAALEKAIGDGDGLLALGGTEDFAFDV